VVRRGEAGLAGADDNGLDVLVHLMLLSSGLDRTLGAEEVGPHRTIDATAAQRHGWIDLRQGEHFERVISDGAGEW
jgi:hypothetical protein